MTNINARRSVLGFAIAALVLGATAPAFALTPQGRTSDGSVVRYDGKSGNYCLSQTVTGSLIAHTTCQSKDAWASDGLNISRK